MNGKGKEEGPLEKEGWTMRFVASEPRLTEAVETYGEAGFEVRLMPLPTKPECNGCLGDGKTDECRICYDGLEDQYKRIFTRPKKFESSLNEDLF